METEKKGNYGGVKNINVSIRLFKLYMNKNVYTKFALSRNCFICMKRIELNICGIIFKTKYLQVKQFVRIILYSNFEFYGSIHV